MFTFTSTSTSREREVNIFSNESKSNLNKNMKYLKPYRNQIIFLINLPIILSFEQFINPEKLLILNSKFLLGSSNKSVVRGRRGGLVRFEYF